MSINRIKPKTQMHENQTTRKISSFISKIYKFAIPAISLFAIANMPKAEAGPMAYAICVETCFATFALYPALLPACVVGCLPALPAPGL